MTVAEKQQSNISGKTDKPLRGPEAAASGHLENLSLYRYQLYHHSDTKLSNIFYGRSKDKFIVADYFSDWLFTDVLLHLGD